MQSNTSQQHNREPGTRPQELQTVAPRLPSCDAGDVEVQGEITLEQPTRLEFRVDYPAAIFADHDVTNDMEDVRARLERVYLYRGRSDVEEREVLDTALLMMQRCERIREYFARYRPECEVLNISLLGSYLWVQRPHDLDFNVIVQGDALELMRFKTPAALFGADAAPLRNRISDVDIMLLGEASLVHGVPPRVVEAANVSNAQEVVDTARADFYIRNFVLSGKDFARLPHMEYNTLVHVSTLLNAARERIHNTYFRKETEQERFVKVVVRLINARAYLNFLLPPNDALGMRDLIDLLADVEAGDKHIADDVKRRTVAAYGMALKIYKLLLGRS